MKSRIMSFAPLKLQGLPLPLMLSVILSAPGASGVQVLCYTLPPVQTALQTHSHVGKRSGTISA